MTAAHNFDADILREYDIRGVVGENLTEDDARALGKAFGTTVRRNGGQRVSVGYDGRMTSPAFEAALIDGITSTGIDVVRVGLGPTPMLYYSVFELDTDGGVMVTASHNPSAYNGFKMMLGKEAFFGDQILALGRLAEVADYDVGSGQVEDDFIIDRYVERLYQDVDVEGLAQADILVGWDPGNGATGDVVQKLVAKLPGRHVMINEAVDGTFPAHHPDPTVEENLQQLKELIIKDGLSIGLAFDGDGDRVGAMDEKGDVVWGDQILAILAEDVLADRPGSTIIADVKASQILFDHIAALGGEPYMWKTGHSLIKSKMVELGAQLAGEMSGHIFFKHKYYGFDDAVYAAIRLLNVVVGQQTSLKKLKDKLPPVINTPEMRLSCPPRRRFEIVKEVHARLMEQGAEVNDTDGVRVLTEDGWWLLRASNTQDVLVARAEGHDDAALQRLLQLLNEQLALSGVESRAS
ncbi:MAG: phosphomannomutase [Kordiimonas sp.]|nr:phosphomannomutase [Kordiimonas sp.]